jgi:uncharacterized protein YkwD
MRYLSRQEIFRLGMALGFATLALTSQTLQSAERVRGESKPIAKTISLDTTKSVPLPSPGPEVLTALLTLHNEARAQKGLAALQLHPKLTAAAQRYAEFSFRTGKFGHQADGKSPADRIAAEGLRHASWAENMAWGQQTPVAAMHTWMNSGGHRGNILSRHAYVGFGRVGGIWVTVFANLIDSQDPAEVLAQK